MSSQPAPLFSVVIPTFNRRSLLLEAVYSVLDQDLKDYEIVVIDDGSTDGTTEAFESLDPSVRLIRHPSNMKRGAARNRGIREARGRFISFLDDDDLYETNHLSGFAEAAGSDGYVALSSGAVFWDATSGRTRPFVRPRLAATDIRSASLQGTALPLPSLCVPREALAGYEPFPEQPEVDGSEDFVFLARLASRIHIQLLDEPTLRIRQHQGRGMKKLDEIIASRRAAMRLLLEEGMPAGPLNANERAVLAAGTARFCAALYYEGHETRKARAELRVLRRCVGWWKSLRMAGRLWLLSWLGAPAIRLAHRLKDYLH